MIITQEERDDLIHSTHSRLLKLYDQVDRTFPVSEWTTRFLRYSDKLSDFPKLLQDIVDDIMKTYPPHSYNLEIGRFISVDTYFVDTNHQGSFTGFSSNYTLNWDDSHIVVPWISAHCRVMGVPKIAVV